MQRQPPPWLVAIQSRAKGPRKQGKGVQTTEALGLTPGTEARPCLEAASSKQVVTLSCQAVGWPPTPHTPTPASLDINSALLPWSWGKEQQHLV